MIVVFDARLVSCTCVFQAIIMQSVSFDDHYPSKFVNAFGIGR